MKKSVINSGDIFGSLVILKEIEKKGNNRGFFVKCTDCEVEFNKYMPALIQMRGNGCRCGVGRKKGTKKLVQKQYKKFEKKLYSIYYQIQRRCSGKDQNRNNKYYFLKGIKCEWNSFEEFYNDMFQGYEPGLSIDRINNDGNYCKENCRWVDIYTQNANRKGVLLEYNGMTLGNYLRKLGYNEKIIQYALTLRNQGEKDLNKILNRIENKKTYGKLK